MSLITEGDEHKIPNEPYTPIAEELTISYNAEETISIKTQSLPIDKDIHFMTKTM